MADNLDPNLDNQDPTAEPTPSPTPTPAPVTPAFSWKSNIPVDYANSPTLQKFSDDKDGLSKAMESHLNLEKLLGHTKVPLPKDDNDIAGIKIFNKALGVPDTADGYQLKDATIPEGIKNISFDKKQFAEVMLKRGVPPRYAGKLWDDYVEMSLAAYNRYVTENDTHLAEMTNGLRTEWGDAYDTNVELGQMVINKFSDDDEMNDFITASMLKDPRGVKFLTKIGGQFAENKIGDFKYQRFALSPDQAKEELSKIRNDPNHPYLNPKATQEEHDRAVEYVNQLEAIVFKAIQPPQR
uniref:Uncharacterized protein n=1 Tax=viral metagenome TaxID=1070528 RepID=A0A6M3XQU4_9ZZZZ